MSETKKQLSRALTLTDATSMVVGGVIGTGVFLQSAFMAQKLGTPTLVLAAWVAAGLLSLAGALTYAELGAMFPRTGGEYVYLNEAYGEVPAFLWGWMQIAVAATGAIAAISTGFAMFLLPLLSVDGVWVERSFDLFGQVVRWQFGPRQVVAVAAIVFFSAVNCLGVDVGGRVQSVLTGAKILGIVAIVAGVFLLSPGANWLHLAASPGAAQWSGAAAFGAAMTAALWAYTGWYTLPVVAGEVQNPERNVPRALILGMLVVLIVYVLTNFSYFYALPFNEITTSNSDAHPDALPVASKAVQTFSGSFGLKFISVAFVVSIAGALNAVILGTARIPYAMARDGLFFARLGEASKSKHVPVRAIMFQAVWASVLALSGTFEQLTTFAIFALWLFYGISAVAVFVLRHKRPEAPRPYRTLGYPVVPLLFVLVTAWLVINTIQEEPLPSAGGLLIIALGLPVYLFFKRSRGQAKRQITSTDPPS